MPNTSHARMLAIACLLVAMALLLGGQLASRRALGLMGPSALAASPAGTQAWVAIDDEIRVFDANGKGVQRRTLQEIGLPGAVYGLDAHPDGSMAVRVDDDPALYLVDPLRLAVSRRIDLQWPEDLSAHRARAVHLAFHRDGRIAASTGGGHAVALFDGDGRFVARTAPGLYRFTNGLWWDGDALWTTDTNRLELRRLDGRTLAVQQSVSLPSTRDTRFLGLARGRPQGAVPSAEGAWASVIRFGHDRIDGVVADVLPGGAEALYPHAAPMEPRDLAWIGDRLLVTDGRSQAILQWDAGRQALPPFGDALAQAEFRDAVQRKARWQWTYRASTGAAIVLVVVALVFARRAPHASPQRQARPVLSGAHRADPRAALASLLVPGLGQWMQRRRPPALIFFLVAAIQALALTGPLAWNWIGPRTEVAARQIAGVLGMQALIAVLAAVDAWRSTTR